jgi:hypothetical protein
VPHAWAYLPDLARPSSPWPRKCDEAPGFRHPALRRARRSPARELRLALESNAACVARPGAGRTGGAKHAGMPWPLIRLGSLCGADAWRGLAEMAYLWTRAARPGRQRAPAHAA